MTGSKINIMRNNQAFVVFLWMELLVDRSWVKMQMFALSAIGSVCTAGMNIVSLSIRIQSKQVIYGQHVDK